MEAQLRDMAPLLLVILLLILTMQLLWLTSDRRRQTDRDGQ